MPELSFNKATDSEHEVKLEPALISISWLSGQARAGGMVKCEIITEFVGNSAPIKLVGKSDNGKKLGKIKDVIRNNKYVGVFDVPEDVELGDHVFFTVKLPKNDLSDESERIPAAPKVEVNTLKWSEKEARREDILKLSAFVDGVEDGGEVTLTIYEYDRDGVHDKITELPGRVESGRVEVEWEYEYHEDTDEIPTQEEMEHYGNSYNPPEYFFTVKVADVEYGREQESGLLEFKDWVEITLRDGRANPLDGEAYTLILPDGSQRNGKLDSFGRAREKNIPPGKCRIRFPDRKGLLE